MIEKSNLPGANLPDGTSASQSPGMSQGDAGVSAADLKRGYLPESVERTPMFSEDADGGANSVGDIYTFGGFLGRPQGTAR